MAAGDATFVPVKNQAYRHYFYIFDNDGDPVTSAAGLDSEVSKDGGAFADCTNEATEVGNGLYYLELTATEMNADNVSVVTKTSTTDAKQACFTFYPQEAGSEIKVDVTHWNGTAVATPTTGGVPEVDVTHIAGSAVSTTAAQLGVNVVQISTDATAADTLELFAEALDQATGQLDSGSFAAGAITAAVIATGAIDDDALADDAVTAIWAKAMQDLSSVPSATASVLDAVNWIFEIHRNKRTQTTSTEVVYKDDGTTQLATSTKTDASGTFTRGEYS